MFYPHLESISGNDSNFIMPGYHLLRTNYPFKVKRGICIHDKNLLPF